MVRSISLVNNESILSIPAFSMPLISFASRICKAKGSIAKPKRTGERRQPCLVTLLIEKGKDGICNNGRRLMGTSIGLIPRSESWGQSATFEKQT